MHRSVRPRIQSLRQILCASVFTVFVASPALAQEAGDVAAQDAEASAGQPNVIIVSAQARSESAQDVPISVAVVGGEQIAQQGTANLFELTEQLPSVKITEAAGGDQLFIRGVGSGINPGFEQSVGTFIDGIYYGRGRQAAGQFLDIQRVEVLKGPQSIYFGNNTIGGALNIATQRPTPFTEGYVRGSYEFEAQEVDLQGALNLPLSDTAAVRFAGRYNEMDGWLDNTLLDRDEQQRRNYTLRGGLLLEPTESLTIYLKAEYGNLYELGNLYQAVNCPGVNGVASPPNCALAVANAGTTGFEDVFDLNKQDVSLGPWAAPEFEPDNKFHELESFDASLNLTWETADGHIVTAITGYTDYTDYRNNVDNDFTPNDIFVVPRTEGYSQFSQELRIASPVGQPIEYVAGLYYQESDLSSLGGLMTTFAGGASLFVTDLQDSRTLSGFAALTWNVTDALRITGGLRYTDVQKDDSHQVVFYELDNVTPLDAASIVFLNNVFGTFESPVQLFERNDDDLTPSVNIEYDVTPDVMVYASYVEGFKAGGFDSVTRANPADPAAFADAINFAPESARSWEAGIKSQFADGRVLLNLAAFRSTYRDLQVSTFDGTAGFLVGNAGRARSQGVDAELRLFAADGLSFAALATYLDASYTEFETAQCRFVDPRPNPNLAGACIQTGETLAYSPDFSGSVNANYTTDLTSDLELSVSGTVNFTSSFFTATDNDPNTLQDGYAKINARIGLGSPGQGWEIALIGRNLTDKLTTSQSNDMPVGAGSYFRLTERPRSIAVQLGYSF